MNRPDKKPMLSLEKLLANKLGLAWLCAGAILVQASVFGILVFAFLSLPSPRVLDNDPNKSGRISTLVEQSLSESDKRESDKRESDKRESDLTGASNRDADRKPKSHSIVPNQSPDTKIASDFGLNSVSNRGLLAEGNSEDTPELDASKQNDGLLVTPIQARLDRIKKAIVLIAWSRRIAVPGILLKREGDVGYIAVSDRILMDNDFRCNLGKVDPYEPCAFAGLVLLKIIGKDLPEPIDLTDVADLNKSLPVRVFGFARELPRVDNNFISQLTVDPCTLLQVHKDRSGVIDRMQLSQQLDHRNRGGAVVNKDGKFVGLALPPIEIQGRGQIQDSIIPHNRFTDLLNGAVAFVAFSFDTTSVLLNARLFDPNSQIESIDAFICDEKTLLPLDRDSNEVQLAAPNMNRFPLVLRDLLNTRQASGKLDFDHRSGVWYYQLRLLRADGTFQLTEPSRIVEKAYQYEPEIFAWDNQFEVNMQIPPEAFLINSGEAVANVGRFVVDGRKLIHFLAISSDNERLFVADKSGIVYGFSVADRRELCRFNLKSPCTYLGVTKIGIVVVTQNRIITLFDDKNLNVLQSIPADGVSRLACTPNKDIAYFWREGDSKVVAVVLATGDVLPLQGKYQLDSRLLKQTSDGQYLLAFSLSPNGGCKRFRIVGDALRAEPSGDEVDPTANGTVAVDPVTQKTYSGKQDSPLDVYSPEGKLESHFDLRENLYLIQPASEATRAIVVHPHGNQVFVLSEQRLYSVRLGASSEEPRNSEKTTAVPTKSMPAVPQLNAVRTWTDKSGKFQIRAKFVGVGQGDIVLLERPDGTQTEIDLDQLSEADQQLLRQP